MRFTTYKNAADRIRSGEGQPGDAAICDAWDGGGVSQQWPSAYEVHADSIDVCTGRPCAWVYSRAPMLAEPWRFASRRDAAAEAVHARFVSRVLRNIRVVEIYG